MKRFLKINLIIIALFIEITNVSASTTILDRTENDLGVNKKWNITEKNIENVYATPRVNASEKIYDYAEIIPDDEEQLLFSKVKEFINQTKIDMVIVTIDEEYSDSRIEEYAADFYDYNDFGIDNELYDGILIVRNYNSYNRYYNIYTFGNAQLYFSYNKCETILDGIYNDLSNDNYLEGFSRFVDLSLMQYNAGIPSDMNGYYVDGMGYLQQRYVAPWFLAFAIAAVVTLIFDLININKNKMVKKSSEAREYLDKNSVNYTDRQDKFITSHTTSYVMSSSSGSSGGGGHSSSGGSSGGGHSSGGGRHG